MGKLILIRHGETSKNIDKELHSVNDEEGLNETGKKQIRLTAQRVAEYAPSIIYSSTEKRALESAKIISDLLKIPMKPVENMHERNWGVHIGKTWEDVKKILDRMTLDERYFYTPQDGESWQTFEARLIDGIREIIAKHKNETVIVISHRGAIRALIPFLLNRPKEESLKYSFDNGSLTIFDYDDKGFSKVLVNDTGHFVEI